MRDTVQKKKQAEMMWKWKQVAGSGALSRMDEILYRYRYNQQVTLETCS